MSMTSLFRSPRRPLLGRALKILGALAAAALTLCLAGAVWYVVEFYPRRAEPFEINSPDLADRVLIATQGSEFKSSLVGRVCDGLKDSPAYVKVMDVGDLDSVDPADWSRVLVLNTVMINIMSGPIRDFEERTRGADNVMLFFTSGGADYAPQGLTVDAISGASRLSDVDRLASMILEWTADDIRPWAPSDGALAMEYVVDCDVGSACAAIRCAAADHAADPALEGRLNRLGYRLAAADRLDDALTVFALNRDLHPESWNVYDSYAEALLASGDWNGAMDNYRKSMELNPDLEYGKRKLEELQAG